jgi:hypothetical protein
LLNTSHVSLKLARVHQDGGDNHCTTIAQCREVW